MRDLGLGFMGSGKGHLGLQFGGVSGFRDKD